MRRQRQVGSQRADHAGVQLLDEVEDVLLVDEAHLQVELRELGLAVGAKVFVAEAAGDLIVLLEAGDHQQLLELLRRLRQGVEVAGIDAARHQVVARALRRRFRQDRRLDLVEAAGVEEVADVLVDAVAHGEAVVDGYAAQVEVAIAQSQQFVDLDLFIYVERRRLRRVQDLRFCSDDFDFARRQPGVLRAGGSGRDGAADAENVLVAHFAGDGVGVGRGLRVEDDLDEAAGIAQVDEDETAVVPPAVHPAGEQHFLAAVLFSEVAAVVCLIVHFSLPDRQSERFALR